MGKVSKEVAEKEVNSWLKHKKLDDEQIEDKKDVIKLLVSSIVSGCLILDKKTFVFTQILKFPIGNDESIKELKFKPRMKVSEIDAKSQNQKSGGGTNKVLRPYVCALTEQNSAIIAELDTEDNRIATAIGTFFL